MHIRSFRWLIQLKENEIQPFFWNKKQLKKIKLTLNINSLIKMILNFFCFFERTRVPVNNDVPLLI